MRLTASSYTVFQMTATNGRSVLLEVLRSEGVTHCFGNPGTTELPFVDALADEQGLHYVLALQENVAVAMADGYAQASGRPSFVNLHSMAGLGGGLGNLTNALANRTPIAVWRTGLTGVDMTLRLDDAAASPPCPQAHQPQAA